MPLEKTPRPATAAPSIPADEGSAPASYGSTTRLRSPEPRRTSATWIARSTVEELPSFELEESSTDTIVGLGASGSRTVPLPRSIEDVPVEVPPQSRVPTVVPKGLTIGDVLADTMQLMIRG